MGGNDVLRGGHGNDLLDGGTGRDFAIYTDATAAITVDLANGVVHGKAQGDSAFIGTDRLRSIEYVRGSNFDDTFDATGFSTTSTNASSITSGSVNNGFEGMDGDDLITGNGGTQLWYRYATAGVTVDFRDGTAQDSADVDNHTTADLAGIGVDSFTGVNSVRGSEFGDRLLGSDNTTRTDVFYGGAGNDFIDGRGGYDLVVYSAAIGDTVTAGVNIDLAAGTVVGNQSVGSDKLLSVELVRGSNFADSFTAVGFNGGSTNAGSFGTFNDFEGMDGNDSITGNGNTRVSYSNATAAVTVDLADTSTGGSGTARDRADAANGTTADLASVGVDTFHGGINSVRGSDFNDRLLGSNNTNTFSVENFLGGKGDDFIDGRGGLDRAQYSTTSDDPYTGGITVQLAAGTVTGDASVGTDTLRSVEFIRATNFNDTYNAAGFSGSSPNVGSNGTFNEFEGMDGNDIVTGNGNTRIAFYNAAAAVTVDLADCSAGEGYTGTAQDSADVLADTNADLAGIGRDRIVSGVNAVAGSAFGDTIRGSNNPSGSAEQLEGRGGNDFLDGRGGFDVAIYHIDQSVGSGIDVNMAAGTVDSDDPAVGLDTLRGIESVTGTRFADHYTAFGFGDSYHLNPLTGNIGSFGTFNEFQGYGGNDTIDGNGHTRISYANASAGVFVDLDGDLEGQGTAYSLGDGDLAQIGVDTFSGVNSVRGSGFGDELFGSSGACDIPADNILDGLGGNDLLDGRGGEDLLIGGSGADTFVYADGYGATVIADFRHSEIDQIDLTGVSGVYSLDDLDITECEGDTVIHFSDGNSLTLTGVVAESLQASDFVFSPAPNQPPIITFISPGTNLIQNGSFEDGPPFIGNAGGHVDPWVLGGSVDYISWSEGGSFAWQAADGDRSLDMSGESAGSISQSFATVVGMQYTVHFSLAGNPTDELQKLQVSAGAATEQLYTFNSTGHTAASMGWTTQSYTFTATSTTTTLSFASIEDGTTGYSYAGPALDNVSVVQSGIAVTEDTPTRLTGITVSDVDSGASAITVTLALPGGNSGALSAVGFGSVTVGGTAIALTLTGSVADINAFLADASHGVIYTPAPNGASDVTLTVTANDNGATGSGGALNSVVQTVLLDVVPVNDAPDFDGHDREATYVASGAAVALVDDVSASDIDSANYNGGSLTATVTTNVHASDMLSIASGGGISVASGTMVMFDFDGAGGALPVRIGTLAGGGDSLTVTLNASATNFAVAALTEAIRFKTSDSTTDTRTVTFTLNDGDGTASGGHDSGFVTATVNVTGANHALVVAGINDAPVIVTDNLQIDEDGGTTTVSGLSVSDADATSTETFTINVITSGGGSAGVTPSTDSGSLAEINTTLDNGITYDPGSPPPLTDMVTVTVADSFGATDSVNFIFNEAGTGSITLQGTVGKDVIFATGHTDTLTGDAGADQFVFSASSGHDIITDFTPGQDRIDLLDDLPFTSGDAASFNAWISNDDAVEQLASGTLIHLDAGDSILLSNVSRANLQINDFILHPGGGTA